jgi:lysophospholipase L1-like esterase
MGTYGTTAFVGDSLTEAGCWSEWLPETTVINFGVSGNTTDDVLAGVDIVIDKNPDTVVLLIGTNDLVWNRSVEHIVRNIESILVNLRQGLPDTQLLVQSLLPRSPEFANHIKEINRHLWQFAPTVKAQYLDLWPVFSRDGVSLAPEYSDDVLHVNEAGYTAWLSELRPALESLRNIPPSSRPINLSKLRKNEADS